MLFYHAVSLTVTIADALEETLEFQRLMGKISRTEDQEGMKFDCYTALGEFKLT